MKKTLLIAFAFVFSSALFAQFSTTGFVPTVTGVVTDVQLKETFFCVNNYATTKTVKVTKIIIDTVPGTTNSFCWGVFCYPDFVYTSGTPITMATGQSDSLLCDYNVYGQAGISHIRYLFWDVTTPSDSMSVMITWVVNPSGVQENTTELATISEAYPNPASFMSAFSFKLNNSSKKATVKIYDVLGNTINEMNVSGKDGVVMIPVSEMQSGVYFYEIISDNKIISSGKLIVTE